MASAIQAQTNESGGKPCVRLPTLHVMGEGKVTRTPDLAIVALGVTEQRATAAEAQAQVARHVTDAMAAIRELGIADAHIRTTQLSLQPVYSQRSNSGGRNQASDTWVPTIEAYRAEYGLRVTVESLDLVGEVLDRGLKAGVNRFDGVSFGVQNEQAVRLAALEAAAADAQTQASTIATAMGVELLGVQQIGDGSISGPPAPPMMMARQALMADAVGASTPMAPGELVFHAQLSVTYRLGE